MYFISNVRINPCDLIYHCPAGRGVWSITHDLLDIKLLYKVHKVESSCLTILRTDRHHLFPLSNREEVYWRITIILL